MTSDLAKLETEVAALPECEDMTPERAAELLTAVDTAMHRARDLKRALEAYLIDWMPSAGVKEIQIGTVRHVVTDKKTTKCRDVRRTIEALLNAVAGDVDMLCDVLSANAIKHGAAKKVLDPQAFAECFEVTTEKDLEQRPIKTLVALDDRFVKPLVGRKE